MQGRNVKVKINAIDIPNAIILPNSITGFISPKVNDKKATAVEEQQKNMVQTFDHNPE